MGRQPDVVPDTPIESAWGNTVRDRSVVPFVNAAERAAQWVTPPAGAVSFLDDVDALEVFNGTAWVGVPLGTGPWLAYTPTWYGAGANIGNSNAVGRYQRHGRTITGHVTISLGSSCSMASDQLAIALPTPAYVATGDAIAVGTAAYWNGAIRYPGSADIHTGTNPDRMRLFTAVYGVGGFVFDDAVKTAVPFAWSPAASCKLVAQFTYEAAN